MNVSAGKKRNFVPFALVLFTLLIGIGYAIWSTGRNKGYAPDQPIPFSHKLHAGQYNIPCLYCHAGAEKSKHATVPSINVCMNCHSAVATDKPNIKKLREFYDKGKPIEWIKVHDLPDFVNFSHKRHVAKGVACETCHGDVKTMPKIKQVSDLTMGWCLNCHTGKTAPDHLYTKEKAFHQAGVFVDPATAKAPIKGSQVAPINCYTCHH
jgi:hypothetical protein